MTTQVKRTRGPAAFLRQLERAIEGLRAGEVVGLNAHYEPNGLGRVSTTTADGADEVADSELPDAGFGESDAADQPTPNPMRKSEP